MIEQHHWQDLQEQLARGQLALFLGADLPREVTGLPPRADLACDLARRYGLDGSLSLAEVAQRTNRGGNRWEFTAFIRDALDATKTPQPFHKRVAVLIQAHQIGTLITTAYDNLLELAFQEAGVAINRVVRGGDTSFINPDRPTLIKLYGDVQQPDTLVVTDRDHSDLLRDREQEAVIDEVRLALRRNTVLFLGYDLSDPDFRFLFDQVAESRFARTAYAVWHGLSEVDVGMWRDRGIAILKTDPLGLLEESIVPPAPRPEQEPIIPPPIGQPSIRAPSRKKYVVRCAVSDFEVHLSGFFPTKAQRFNVKWNRPGVWVVSWYDETQGYYREKDTDWDLKALHGEPYSLERVYIAPEPIGVATVKATPLGQGCLQITVSTKGHHSAFADAFWRLFEPGIKSLMTRDTTFAGVSSYHNLEILIGDKQEMDYPIHVIASPAGEGEGVFNLPFSEDELWDTLVRLERSDVDEVYLIEFGIRLFKALFAGDVMARYAESVGLSRESDGLRIRLRIDPPKLQALPWELLYDPEKREFLVLSKRALVTRYLHVPRPSPPLAVDLPLRVLVAVAAPDDMSPLSTDVEVADIRRSLRPLIDKGIVHLTVEPHTTKRSLRRRLMDAEPHVLHYVGHGGLANDRGVLFLEDGEGRSDPLDSPTLGTLLKGSSVQLVVLNACLSARDVVPDSPDFERRRAAYLGVGPALVDAGLGAVVAMQFSPADRSARAFAEDFYAMLARFKPVDECVSRAREALLLEAGIGGIDWATPVLFMRAADGQVFAEQGVKLG